MFVRTELSKRLQSLQQHLKNENPILSEVVVSFNTLDQISRRLGFFSHEESHATRMPWWPLISILGIYSAGKSAFINYYLGQNLQATGNQAVDDKFTVICFTNESGVRVLPGLALDADPRFPLYNISQAIEEVAEGDGDHVDAYLQLKTCPSEKLRGRILIDSPGFDADAQRTSTLRITDHIVDISDLILVFFDARHPESGSMPDTLRHLVQTSINRRDSNKFVYILNQIDNTAREDNPEEVFAAWQRALAQYGLTAGCCYAVYNPEVAVPIENTGVRVRLERKRDADMKSIQDRIEQVGVERAYRIVGMLEHTTRKIEQKIVPRLQRFIEEWRQKVLWLDGIIFSSALLVFLVATIWAGYWQGFNLKMPLWEFIKQSQAMQTSFFILLVGLAGYVHFSVRRRVANRVSRKMLKEVKDPDEHPNYLSAFLKNSSWQRSIFFRQPVGWNKRAQQGLADVLEDTNAYIQKLNDRYTNPSGLGTIGTHTENAAVEKNGPADAEGSPEDKPLKVVAKE